MNHTWTINAYHPESEHLVASYPLPRVMWPILTAIANIQDPTTLGYHNAGDYDITEAQARALLRPCGIEDAPVDMAWSVGPDSWALADIIFAEHVERME